MFEIIKWNHKGGCLTALLSCIKTVLHLLKLKQRLQGWRLNGSANNYSWKKALEKRKKKSPQWVLKERKQLSEHSQEKTSAIGERGSGYFSLAFLGAVFTVIRSHASSALAGVTLTHMHTHLSSQGVKQTHALWLKSGLIYFTRSKLMSSCSYAMNKNSRIFYLIIYPHVSPPGACTSHRVFWLLQFSHNLAVERLWPPIRSTDNSCRPGAL